MATDTVVAAAAALPDDVLEDILGRLPVRSLAASQLVCRAWRDLVGERRLLLPHSVAGLFVNYIDHFRPHFFARPKPPADGGAAQTAIDGAFSFIAREKPYEYNVLDHCNGLVLHSGDHRIGGEKALYLCNPATRRWARLPRSNFEHWKPRAFVAFDPAVSPHWEPPATWTWHVFSSTTMRWEEKVFIGEGEAAGTVADLLLHSWNEYDARWRSSAAYWQGALYMNCRGEYVSRNVKTTAYNFKRRNVDFLVSVALIIEVSTFSLTWQCQQGAKSFIGRSGNGVCFGALDADMVRLHVWILDESSDGNKKTEWVLKHRCNVVNPDYWQMRYDGPPWTIAHTISTGGACHDDENDYHYYHARYQRVTFLGFHPYKEVVFLGMGNSGVACHLDTGKVQDLGVLDPGCYNRGPYESFVDTPCLMGV
ncbi:hypothetical protein PVAP13_8NG318284 [Panicum virgatum]|uniref:F-box domain-containing protein n=1 Tax=Panicum virgatum TaxID=38727 RepID=A0A8T0PDN4_PANVG|nr:hypothetical protein PVAP13_8NG318284 [Panicum virgatum]